MVAWVHSTTESQISTRGGQRFEPRLPTIGFAGGLSDAVTGVVRFDAREYDVQTRRWTNKDLDRGMILTTLKPFATTWWLGTGVAR